MKLLLKCDDLYTPKHMGIKDVLIDGDKIVEISNDIKVSCETIDCRGQIVCPMFVDGHEHLKNTEFYNPKDILNSGVGTSVGCLANEQNEQDVEKIIEITKQLKM